MNRPLAFNELEQVYDLMARAIDEAGEENEALFLSKLGITLAPTYMILFGGPGPGGKAMAEAPTLGLDAFCQKFLVWQDEEGNVFLSFNDLVALAQRQQVAVAPVLRVINLRLKRTFTAALEK